MSRFQLIAVVALSLGWVCLLSACANGRSPYPGASIYSPYKHVNQGLDPAMPVITAADSGRALPYVSRLGAPALTWAFATGECGQETWGGIPGELLARTNVPLFERARIGYIVSTGGEGGGFRCPSEAGMEAFIRRYASEFLLGIDFDIESDQTPEQIAALVSSVKAAQRRHPELHFSFTLATHAAADGSRRSLNRLGETVLAAIRSAGLVDFRINLMVMNYGPPEAAYCVPEVGRCAMARSAVQAAENVHLQYGVPYRQIELTAMLGENDVAGNVFGLADAEVLAGVVRERGLAGLHYWSLDRDAPCLPGAPRVSANCSGTQAPAGAFARAFETGLR